MSRHRKAMSLMLIFVLMFTMSGSIVNASFNYDKASMNISAPPVSKVMKIPVSNVGIAINGKPVTWNTKSLGEIYVTSSGTSMVPLRAVGELIGYTIDYKQLIEGDRRFPDSLSYYQQVDISYKSWVTSLYSQYAHIDTRKEDYTDSFQGWMDVRYALVNDRVYLPIRDVVESLGGSTIWTSALNITNATKGKVNYINILPDTPVTVRAANTDRYRFNEMSFYNNTVLPYIKAMGVVYEAYEDRLLTVGYTSEDWSRIRGITVSTVDDTLAITLVEETPKYKELMLIFLKDAVKNEAEAKEIYDNYLKYKGNRQSYFRRDLKTKGGRNYLINYTYGNPRLEIQLSLRERDR